MNNNHLACIGFSGPNDESLWSLVRSALSQTKNDVPPGEGYLHARWTDSSGASLAFHIRENEGGQPAIECVTPFFEPSSTLSQVRARSTAIAPDLECVHCSGINCDLLDRTGGLVTRATVQLLNFFPYHEWLRESRQFDLDLVAFAHKAAFFENHADFDEGQRQWLRNPDGSDRTLSDGRRVRLAETSFLPVGMFYPVQQSMNGRATAIFAGRLETSALLTNSISGTQFRHVRIETLPGALDVVFDACGASGQPTPGNLALVHAWLVGRPAVPPPRKERGWKALFKKRP